MTHPEPTPDTEERRCCRYALSDGTNCQAHPLGRFAQGWRGPATCDAALAATPPQAAPVDGLREALLVELAASIPGTCDWGGCDNNALLARHDAELGWLGVCQWHAADASSGDLAPITAVAFEDAWNRAALAPASEGEPTDAH